MAAESLNVNPCLRPWQRAGVEFLLADNALAAPYSLCIAAPVVMGGRIGAGQGTAANGAAGAPAGGVAASSTYGAHGTHNGVARPTQGTTGSAAQAARAGNVPSAGARPQPSSQVDSFSGSPAVSQGQEARSGNPANLATPANQTQRYSGNQALPHLPPAQWPALWQERLKKTAPATVLWTYWALGEDMCVRPNPTRRALLQKLLADLGHPAGTHSFWPTALPASTGQDIGQHTGLSREIDPQAQSSNQTQNSGQAGQSLGQDLSPAAPALAESAETLLYPAPEVFWSGVQLLKARAVVVMGSPALKALELPPRLRPFQQTRHNGMLIVVLRDVDFLAQEVHRYDAVKAFLRQALAPFGR